MQELSDKEGDLKAKIAVRSSDFRKLRVEPTPEKLAAVLENRTDVKLAKTDIFARVAGGFRADEPGVDLALALALASAMLNKPVPADLVAIGEVGLSGDVRAVPGIDTRLRECARLGFRRAVVGRSVGAHADLEVRAVSELREAIALVHRG